MSQVRRDAPSRRSSTWIARLLVGLVMLSGSTDGRAQTVIETFDRPGGALDGVLTPGTDGPWTLSIANGVAELENRTDPTAIRFYRIERLRGGLSPEQAAVAVDVSGDFPERVSASGILYRYDAATRSYLAFVVGARRWTLYQRGPEGMRPRLSGELAPGPNPIRRLRVQPDGDRLVLEIDGKPVGRVEIANMPGGAVGLVAFGKGRFDFDNLAIVPKSP